MSENNAPPYDELVSTLQRIADALEAQNKPAFPLHDFSAAGAFVWVSGENAFRAVRKINRVDLNLLRAIALQRTILLENTKRFHDGHAANNALLWGARGMGKSSLVKAVHAEIDPEGSTLKLIEIHREDIETLPDLMGELAKHPDCRFILFCDDLSFDGDDTSYKSLKTVLEGGLEGRPKNVIFYATSNRRHLLPRDMMDNERATAINPGEAIEEKVSLSDRFGLWIGFHNCSQDDYIAMIEGYVAHFDIPVAKEVWRPLALEWSTTRGARSGRVAWQFVQDMAGAHGISLD